MYGNENYGGFLDHWHRAVAMSKGENKIFFKLTFVLICPTHKNYSLKEKGKMTVSEQAEVKLKYKFHNGTKTKMILHNLYCKLF